MICPKQGPEGKGFDVEQDRTRSCTPRATLTMDSGVFLLVRARNDGTVVNIDSASLCLSLPDELSLDPLHRLRLDASLRGVL